MMRVMLGIILLKDPVATQKLNFHISMQREGLFDINSTIGCPHSIILRVVDTIDVKKILIRKENSYGFFFSKICSNPGCDFFCLSFSSSESDDSVTFFL
jgi:hypothetical protein